MATLICAVIAALIPAPIEKSPAFAAAVRFFDMGKSATEAVTRFKSFEAIDPRSSPVKFYLAYALDASESATTDTILKGLMEWATTVVRLPRNAGDSNWLSEEMASFPATLLLFSRQIRELVFDDRTTVTTRKLAVRFTPNIGFQPRTLMSSIEIFKAPLP